METTIITLINHIPPELIHESTQWCRSGSGPIKLPKQHVVVAFESFPLAAPSDKVRIVNRRDPHPEYFRRVWYCNRRALREYQDAQVLCEERATNDSNI
jgi:hypothetical protein